MDVFELVGRMSIEGIDKSKKQLRGLESFVKKNEKAFKAAGKAMTIAGGLIVGGLAISMKAAADFEGAMREVNTMMGLSQEEFKTFSKEVQTLAADLGVDAVDSAKALYQAISAGVPKENVLDFLKIATEAAIGGVTETKVAVDGLTTVINAFKLPMSEAQKVADIMFTTVKGGKTTFEELSASLFQVAPIAAASGVRFEEVAAALATMTKQGVPTSVATTQLRQAMVALQKPTADMNKVIKALGYESGQVMLKELGLANTLNTLRDATHGSNEQLMKMFGSVEAGQAVLSLTGENAVMFTADLEAMAKAEGAATAAFLEMEESASRQMERLKSSFKDISISVGSVLLPILKDLIDNIKPIIESVKNWIAENPGLTRTVIIITAAVGGLLLALGPLLMMLPGIVAAAPAVGAAFTAMLGPVGLIILGIVALTAAGIALWKNWDKVVPFFEKLWASMKTVFGEAVKFLVKTVLQPFLQYIDKFLGNIVRIVGKVVSIFNKDWGAAIENVSKEMKNLDQTLTDWADTVIESGETSQKAREKMSLAAEAAADTEKALAKAEEEAARAAETATEKTRKLAEQYESYITSIERLIEMEELAQTEAGKLGLSMDDLKQHMIAGGREAELLALSYEDWLEIGDDIDRFAKRFQLNLEDIAIASKLSTDDMLRDIRAVTGEAKGAARDRTRIEIDAIDDRMEAYRDAHRERMDQLRDEYNETIKTIDAGLRASLRGYQDQIDLINGELQAVDDAGRERRFIEEKSELESRIADERDTKRKIDLEKRLNKLILESGNETWQAERRLALENQIGEARDAEERANLEKQLADQLTAIETNRRLEERRLALESSIAEATDAEVRRALESELNAFISESGNQLWQEERRLALESSIAEAEDAEERQRLESELNAFISESDNQLWQEERRLALESSIAEAQDVEERKQLEDELNVFIIESNNQQWQEKRRLALEGSIAEATDSEERKGLEDELAIYLNEVQARQAEAQSQRREEISTAESSAAEERKRLEDELATYLTELQEEQTRTELELQREALEEEMDMAREGATNAKDQAQEVYDKERELQEEKHDKLIEDLQEDKKDLDEALKEQLTRYDNELKAFEGMLSDKEKNMGDFVIAFNKLIDAIKKDITITTTFRSVGAPRGGVAPDDGIFHDPGTVTPETPGLYDPRFLQEGGIAMRPMLAKIAEKVPEVVIPLDRSTLERLGLSGGGYKTANIYVMLDEGVLAEAIEVRLVDDIYLRTGSRIL